MLLYIRIMDLSEIQERVIQSYRILFDFSLACEKCGLSEETKRTLEKDALFQERLSFFIIEERESIFNTLKVLMVSGDSDAVRLKATLELGKILYPERFIEGYDKESETKLLGTIIHKVQNGEVTAEVLKLLAENGALSSEIEEATFPETD